MATVRVTPLLSIDEECGDHDVVHASAMLLYGSAVTVASSKMAFDVLVGLGATEEFANKRINLALTGEWVG